MATTHRRSPPSHSSTMMYNHSPRKLSFPSPASYFATGSRKSFMPTPPPAYASGEVNAFPFDATTSAHLFVATRWVPPLSETRNPSGPPPYSVDSDHSEPTSSQLRRLSDPCQLEAEAIPSMRGELRELDSLMAAVARRRALVHERLETAVHRVPPIDRLPTEILGAIFDVGVNWNSEMDSLLLPVLMLVCSRWKDTAVGTPQLWSRISIKTHDSLTSTRRRLLRSGSLPLDIFVNFSPRPDQREPSTEEVVRAMSLLQASVERWRSFRLVVPNRSLGRAALMNCRNRAPLLEELAVKIDRFLDDDPHYQSLVSFPLFDGYTPRLKASFLSSFNFGWRGGVVHGLRILHLDAYWGTRAPKLADLLSIVRDCPELEDFSLRTMADDFGGAHPDGSASTAHLPRLRKMALSYSESTQVAAFLSHLAFPVLESAEFSHLIGDISPVFIPLQIQARSSLPLRTLRIEGGIVNEKKFISLLNHLPSLVALELADIDDISSRFLQEFAIPPVSKSWLCPKLERLGLQGCTSVDWISLRNVIESRLPAYANANPRAPVHIATPRETAVPSGTDPSPLLRVPIPSLNQAEPLALQVHGKPAIPPSAHPTLVRPRRLLALDILRCPQLSGDRERLQWLNMYVNSQHDGLSSNTPKL